MRFRVTSKTRGALKGSITLITSVSYAEMNGLLMLAKILLDVKDFVAVIALESWTLVIDHVCLDVAQGVEHFAALFTWNFLLGSVGVVDVISQSWVTVKAFAAVLTFVFSFSIVDVSYKKSNAK
jgi:hypothetical protein